MYLICCFLDFSLKIQPCGYLTKKCTSILWEKNPHSRILKEEPKEQHLSTVPKSCSYIYIYIYIKGGNTSRKIEEMNEREKWNLLEMGNEKKEQWILKEQKSTTLAINWKTQNAQ